MAGCLRRQHRDLIEELYERGRRSYTRSVNNSAHRFRHCIRVKSKKPVSAVDVVEREEGLQVAEQCVEFARQRGSCCSRKEVMGTERCCLRAFRNALLHASVSDSDNPIADHVINHKAIHKAALRIFNL